MKSFFVVLRRKLKNGIKNIKVERYTFIKLYFKLLLFGFALTGLAYTFLQNLRVCTGIFGGNVCDPVGNYIVALSSFPGYFIASIVLFFLKNLSEIALTLIIFSVSFLFYFILGYTIENKIFKNINFKSVQTLIVVVFVLLLIALIIVI